MNGGEPPIPIEWKTVSGSAPLTFSDALSNEIRSLIQYGKCVTSGGDTYCNNGKMTAVDDELPSGYKRLLGITFDGNFHYRTGEALTGDDDVTMTLDNLSASGKNVFGSYNGANDKNFSMYIYGSSTSGSYFRYGDQLKRPKYGGTGRRTITFGASGTSGFAEDSDVTPDEFTTPANTYIGMLPNSSSAAYTGDIVGSILVSNRLEWIPTERETDGVIGYYEKYNGNFIAPTGSGTPVSLGYDTSHMTALSVVGTPEVLTVMGKNLADPSEVYHQYVTINGYYGDDTTNVYRTLKVSSLKAGKYTFSTNLTNVYITRYRYRYEGSVSMANVGSTRSSLTFTLSKNVTDFGIAFRKNDSTEITEDFWVQLELGSTATEYEPYTSQTASVVNLFSDGTVHDEQDIISGAVTRRTEVVVSGGVISISALSSPVTERVTPKYMSTVEGSNTVTVTSAVDPVTLTVEYATAAGD